MKLPTIIALLLTLLAGLLMAPWIPRPFTGHHDFVGAFNSQMARNYLRYGFLATKLGQVTNFGTVGPGAFSFHTHHPPGVPLFLAFVYRLFGEHEWVARGSFAVFAAGSTVLLFLMISDAASFLVGSIATLLMVTTPMFVYPSILPVYESPALFLVILQIFCFKRWLSTGKRMYLTFLVVGALVGFVTAWVTYVTVPILIVERVLSRSSRGFRFLVILCFTSILFFSLHLAHTKLLTGDWFGGGLRDIFLRRTGMTPEPNQAFSYTIIKYIDALMFRLKNFYGIPLLATSMVGIVTILVNYVRRYPDWGDASGDPAERPQRSEDVGRGATSGRTPEKKLHLGFLLTGVALALPVLFRNYVFVHDYLLYYTAPLIGFTAAVGVVTAIQWFRTFGLLENVKTASVIMAITLVGITALATRVTWKDLWESITWDETSLVIGERLRSTTTSDQSILIVNQPLKEEETNLQYYADRAVSFPVADDTNPYDPDVMVNVISDYQFPEGYRGKILEAYRLEIDQSVEYYYRK